MSIRTACLSATRIENEPSGLLPDYNPAVKIEEKDGEWYLSINPEKSWSEKTKPITCKLLGTAVIPQQPFTDTKIDYQIFTTDYQGIKRNNINPSAGPFEIKKEGLQRIKVWTKK